MALLAGTILTAALARALAPRPYQAAATGGPTSAAVELILATLVVPAQPFATIQTPSMTWTGSASTTGGDDHWRVRIRDTNVTGTVRLLVDQRQGAETTVDTVFGFAGAGEDRFVAANTAATYVLTITREVGTGTLTTVGTNGNLKALVMLDPVVL